MFARNMKRLFSRTWLQLFFVFIAACFLAFVAGAYVADFRVGPYATFFKPAFDYMRAEKKQQATVKQAQAMARRAPPEGRLTVRPTPEAYPGYTFLTFDVDRPSTARLLDMDGKIVHEWHRDLREIWPDTPQREKAAPDDAIAWRYARLFPNGDIITTIKAWGDTPDGYGIAKFDKDSKVIWAVPDNFHHHFSIASDGRIYGITHQWRDMAANPIKGINFLPKKVLEDFVVELSPDGKELSRFSLLEAMAGPGARQLLGSTAFKAYKVYDWDRLHPNDIEVIDANFASHHSLLKPGMLLISLRDLDALIVLDPATRKLVWCMRGPWVRQHDPDLLASGNLLLFDNLGNNMGGGSSRVLEIDFESGRILWTYSGGPKRLRSERSGGEERLPNGNTLISEDERGRVLEVTPTAKIVWEYTDASVHHAMRVAPDWLEFVPSGHPLAPTTATALSAGAAQTP